MAVTREGHDVSLSNEGGIVSWSYRGKHLFYPRERFGGKWRGGMHACVPNFGDVAEHYGLPKHGPLRGLVGETVQDRVGQKVEFTGSHLLGIPARKAIITTEVQASDGGFFYQLRIRLGRGEPPLRLNPGLHPYLSTPLGTAEYIDEDAGDSYSVGGLLERAIEMPFGRNIKVRIPGLGTIEMRPNGAFLRCMEARILLWRDRRQYLCVEPVLTMPELYDTQWCPQLAPDQNFAIWCSFRFIP